MIRACMLGFTVLMLGCKGAPPSEKEPEVEAADPPVPVTCEAARSGTTDDRVMLRGVVAAPPERDAVVAAAVAGRIVELRVHEGDAVKRGAVLAQIADPTAPDAVAEAAAAVSSAKASSEVAAMASARAERMLAKGVAATRDVEEAHARAQSAEAELHAAQAKAGLAAAQRSYSRPIAPLAGTVIRVFRRVGELVDGTPATPIVEIADTSTLELAADAPALDLIRLRLGAVADLTFEIGGKLVAGSVVALAPAVDPTTSLGLVRVRLDDPSRVRIGMAGVAAIVVGAGAAVTLVPTTALRRSPEGRDEVVVCSADGHANVRAVRTGARSGSDVAIVEGVAVGEAVVTRHALGLADGAAIVRAGTAP